MREPSPWSSYVSGLRVRPKKRKPHIFVSHHTGRWIVVYHVMTVNRYNLAKSNNFAFKKNFHEMRPFHHETHST